MVAKEIKHCAVLRSKVVEYLDPKPGQIVMDATLGCGGHALEISELIGPSGLLIGIDRDEQALAVSKEVLGKAKCKVRLYNGSFSQLKAILLEMKVEAVDMALFDLGVSSLQLDLADRGFSIMRDGPLDMRMDRSQRVTAFDIVNGERKDRLIEIFKQYGEERMPGRIVSAILKVRRKNPIRTTRELATLIEDALPYKMRFRRLHPATRVFMALRIAVNNEMEEIRAALDDVIDVLNPGGRICVISFHSIEDRVVKHTFREYARKGRLSILTKKPVIPTDDEMTENPRARSAKLRAAEVCG